MTGFVIMLKVQKHMKEEKEECFVLWEQGNKNGEYKRSEKPDE